MNRSEPTLIGSVQRALHLLDAVGSSDRPVTAKALARQTGQNLATTYHLLRTLVHEGYLLRTPEGYLLGDRFSALRSRTRNQMTAARVRPALRMLHDEVGAAAYLSLYRDGEIECTDIVDSTSSPRVDIWVGLFYAGHATAIGKCILTNLPEEERLDYLSRHELAELTPRTITDRRTLLAELERDRPYGVDREEYAVGWICLAVPIEVDGTIGSVGVSLPSKRMNELPDLRKTMRRAANRIGLALSVPDS